MVSDSKVSRIIKECYEQLIPISRYPITALYIEVDPSLIDVNIHPRKQEIKFSEMNSLLDLIKSAIEKVVRPQKIYQKPDEKNIEQTKIVFQEVEKEDILYQEQKPLFEETPKETKADKQDTSERVIPDMEYIGQYLGTYLIFQNEEGLYLLDQHAAAERIRYERYQILMNKKNPELQELLVPLKLELSNEILTQAKDYIEEIKKLGVHLDIIDNEVVIDVIPSWFPQGYELIYTEAIIMNYIDGKTPTKDSLIDDLAKLLACKHSLKANHYISNMEANQLLNDLRKCKRPYTCPHGRPIIVTMSIGMIERWFNRVI